jgi:Ran GTPase-activating protein (RanGAP) involved in mRNA processing and transport
MAWGRGAPAGVDDLCARLQRNDATLTSLTLLAGRRFGPPEVSSLAAALRDNTTLTELCAVRPLAPDGAAELAAALQRNATLRRLCVGDAAFGDDGVAALAPGTRRLQRLELERKGLTPIGAAALAAAMSDGELEELSVARNDALGDDGTAALLAAGAGRGLQSLDAGGCGLTPRAGAALAPLLATAAQLRALVLSDNALGPEGASRPYRARDARPTCLTHVSPTGCAALAAGLAAARSLRELELNDCGAGDDGAAALGNALPGSSLARLSLARCGVGAVGASMLAVGVERCVSLTHLCLEGNATLGDVGACTLAAGASAAAAAGTDARIAVLDLGSCGIGVAGAVALLSADAAASLSLLGNPCAGGADGIALAAALTGRGRRMTHLNLSGTGLDADGGAALAAALLAGAAPALRTLELGANPVRRPVDLVHLSIEVRLHATSLCSWGRRRRGRRCCRRCASRGPTWTWPGAPRTRESKARSASRAKRATVIALAFGSTRWTVLTWTMDFRDTLSRLRSRCSPRRSTYRAAPATALRCSSMAPRLRSAVVRFDALPEEALRIIMLALPVDARARAACVRRSWRASSTRVEHAGVLRCAALVQYADAPTF